ncbi:MAG: phosphate ABC transporter permease subunit PstC [Verrucomicrobiota bacterium]|nr:phosphate ABC transporter permease subunit PstC [Verrucomicrobiota bacterium]
MESLAARSPAAIGTAATRQARITSERVIKGFFASNALVAIVVLALITIFLFREGFGFFGQNLKNMRLYRRAGLEFVDIIRGQAEQHAALSRKLSDIRLHEVRAHADENVLPAFDQFAAAFSDAGEELNGLVSDTNDQALALRDSLTGTHSDSEVDADDNQAPVPAVDQAQGMVALRSATDKFEQSAATLKAKIDNLLAAPPQFMSAKARQSFKNWKGKTREYLAQLPAATQQLREWDPHKPVPAYRAVTSFLFGPDWVTASFWQDWYGIIPLLVGSIMVAVVALVLAVPLGVASAIYVSEVAHRSETRLIKPYIEFISAIPSVVLGFFGIAVVGEAVRALSRLSIMQWVPFFPISERLNVFTAGSLLALMAVPTIFTLAEDALRNVPRGFKEASYALGANRLQTIARVLVPASLSGIISAILLGLGRVIGETMVVLLCAGNRIAVPDFTDGLGAFFQPVHTMTGIVAQEMGEVVRGSIHYRALFMVGLVLFVLTLGINYLAQKIVSRYRMSIG